MQRHGVKSRTKLNVATAVLIAAMLAFVGDASAAKNDIDMGEVTVCTCHGACRVVTTCLGNYCIKETRCGDCEVCTPAKEVEAREKSKPKGKLCLYQKDNACVTRVRTDRR
jgi:hypothetical protein